MRLESADAAEDEIAAEVNALANKWRTLTEKAAAAQAPCMIEGREGLLPRLLRDEPGGVAEILQKGIRRKKKNDRRCKSKNQKMKEKNKKIAILY